MIKNCGMLQFRRIESISDKNLGALTPIEFPSNIPFDINRVYYIYDVANGVTRGFHSHRQFNYVNVTVFVCTESPLASVITQYTC